MKLKFRIPLQESKGRQRIRDFVGRAWVEGTKAQADRLFEEGKVKLDGILAIRPERVIAEQSLVEVELDEDGEEVFGLPDAETLLWGDNWVVVEKPVGIPGRKSVDDPMDPIRFLADLLGLDREFVEPLWNLPASAGGPWILTQGKESQKLLREAMIRRELQSVWQALILRPPRSQGRWETDLGTLDYAVTRTKGPIAEVQITPVDFKGIAPGEEVEAGKHFVERLLEIMATAGFAALGDLENGGYLVEGGLRMSLGTLYGLDPFAHSWSAPRDWWPEEEVIALSEDEEEGEQQEEKGIALFEEKGEGRVRKTYGSIEIRDLQVSSTSLRIMKKKGHPWVLRDKETGSLRGLTLGHPVRLVSGSEKSSVFAVVDETDQVVARYFSDEEEAAREFYDELAMRLDEAIHARRDLFKDLAQTDAFRVLHGEADGVPGLWIDRLGPVYRFTSLGKCAEGYRDFLVQELLERLDGAMIIHVDHTQDLRRRESLPRAEVLHHGGFYLREGEPLILREEGLKYRVEPWEGVDVGFFADQRCNRRRAVELAEAQAEKAHSAGEQKPRRWLNLFCHTGAFSVALASKGVETVNVDLSKRYLSWFEENLELNGLAVEPHQQVAEDGRYYLERTKDRFDGIIVDPPTASSGSRGFWSIRDHYGDLLKSAFSVLNPQGVMLVCRNEKRPREGLAELIEKAAKEAGVAIRKLEIGGPSPDFPGLEGFPEGDKFEGYWVFCA